MTLQLDSIEGATPVNDCSGLKLSWVHTQRDLNRAEAENIVEAQRKYLRQPIKTPLQWFQPAPLRNIHKAMYGKVWDWAGEYRRAITSIGIRPQFIPSKLAELCHDVEYWLTNAVELSFLEQAARIHHRMVFIHPFENGNGRFSRLVSDLYLLFWNCPHPHWPIELQSNGSARSTYIGCLKSADQGDYQPLTHFMETLGAKDPLLVDFLSSPIYTKRFTDAQRLSLVKALLRLGYPIDKTNDLGDHPLQTAIKKGDDAIALLLIQEKTNIQFRDRSGHDPFELAISLRKFEIANALVKAGYPYVRGIPRSSRRPEDYAKFYEFETQLL